MGRALVVLAVSGLGIVAGVFSLDLARDEPARSFAGGSAVGGAALLGAGWALIGSGAAVWVRRRDRRFGALLAAAGFAWFLLEWNNPAIGPSLAFTAGLWLYVACPPLVAHAVLAYPDGRLTSWIERGVVAAGYLACVVALGALPALLFDPQARGCAQCPENLLVIANDAGAVDDLNRVGLRVALTWAVLALALTVLRLARASVAARRARGPVLLVGSAYLALAAGWFAASLDRGYLSNGTLERRLWLGQAAAVCAVAAGVAWSWVRARRARASVARLVVDLAESPPPGGLRDVLAGIVGDPGLTLAYPLDGADRLVDAVGRTVELSPRQEGTTLVREGRPVAVLGHAPGLLDDGQLVEEVTAAARLALENERLQAEVRARLEELRASRARIVEAGDAERKRLERDLHDGAQQRLVVLSLSLALLRSQLPPDAVAATPVQLADAELRTAIAELRELAHGIFPAVLADEGFAAAVEALAEEARVPIRIRGLPEGRDRAPVETAAYTVVAELARTATSGLLVDAERVDGVFAVEVETNELQAELDLAGLEDRVGALDGRLTVRPAAAGRVTIRAELPCAS